MNAVIAIAGCKNSGKSSLCKYIYYLVARLQGFIYKDPYRGTFTNKNLAQVTRDAGKCVYISKDGSSYQEAELINNPSVEILSFADPVKKICTEILCLNRDQVFGSDEEKNTETKYDWSNFPEHIKIGYGENKLGKLTAREVMQIIGTDIFRNYFSKNVWVDALMEKVKNSKSELILVDDLRFDSEAEALMANGAMIIHLQRLWGKGGSHKSENGLNLDLFTGYPHFCSIPDVDMMSKNDFAFNALKEYFKHVITKQSSISE